MACVIACLMAAASFLLNKAALRYAGARAVITCSPVLEEAAKTLPAYYLGASIFLTHAGFGLIEAVYDWFTTGERGVGAAALSILGHSLFGLATAGTLWQTGSVLLALAAGTALHLAWNVTAIRLDGKG